jgi:hypothetical protein
VVPVPGCRLNGAYFAHSTTPGFEYQLLSRMIQVVHKACIYTGESTYYRSLSGMSESARSMPDDHEKMSKQIMEKMSRNPN